MNRALSGCTLKDVPAAEFINTYAMYLKRLGQVELPSWVDTVKTGTSRELAPLDPDWFYIRIASIARKIYLNSGTGVGTFRKTYGASKRRGMKPSRSSKASGGIIRNAINQLERLGVVEKDPRGGRRITRKGQAELDGQALACLGISS